MDRYIKVLMLRGRLQMLAVLLRLAEIGGHLGEGLAEKQNLLLMLLAELSSALDVRLEGSDLITKAALLILALIELARQCSAGIPLCLDALPQVALGLNKAGKLLLSSPHSVLDLIACLVRLIQLAPELCGLLRGC